MDPHDTSADALERQRAILRSMTPQERARIAEAMSADARAIVEAGIRYRHPNCTDAELRSAVAEIYLGRELARRSGRAPGPR